MNNQEHVKKAKKTKVPKPLTEKKKVGNLGEDIACIYLERAGYTIVERNFLRKYGELDIIAQKNGLYHFVEVKSVTRATVTAPKQGKVGVIHETDTYRPEDNMHPWKLKRLARTIQAYVLERQIGENWQFDVITVVLNMKTRRARVELMENIVL